MRLREPAAWVALGALVLNLVLAVVAMATYPGPAGRIGLTLSARARKPRAVDRAGGPGELLRAA